MRRNTGDTDTSALEHLISLGASDLTQRALGGQLARAYGREAEVGKVFECLAARRSVLLLGPANVGKTAILHEVTSRMARNQAPAELEGAHVVAISTGAVLVGTKYLGEWQTRFGELLEAVKAGRRIFLYLEDVWALRDAGRASDKADGFSTFLRPYLERKEIVVIGETTPDNYSGSSYGARALADDPSLMKLFDVLPIEEPSRDATKGILTAVARDLQRTHKVRIEATCVERAIELTRRFLPYQAFPGKATHLLQEAAKAPAGAAAAEPSVSADVVTATFSRITGLPEKIISDTIPLTQEEIRAYFSERIIGQDEAVNVVADVVTLVKAELNDPGRPLGVLFFVGPTGVGKTELAKTLAEYLFGSKDKLIRIDMSEFQTAMTLPDLLAQLTEKQRRESFSVLLLDEFEKASTYVFDLFLQVFDDARLTDAAGKSVDLHNTIIIMTSNIGTELSGGHGLGFLDGDRPEERRLVVARAVEEYFRPEFINRLDRIVVFKPLGAEEMRRIARRELGKALMREGVLRRNILLDFRDEVLDMLVQQGFSPTYGARPLQRAIREEVLLPLARRIAAQPASGEQLLELCVVDGRIDAASIPVNAATQPEPPEPEARERLTVLDAASGRTRRMDLRHLLTAIEGQRQRIEAHIAGPRYLALEMRAMELLEETSKPTFWDDNERARQILSAVYHIERVTDRFNDLRSRAERLAETAEMIRRHGDAAGLQRLAAGFEQLERDVSLAELELLAGESDALATDAVFLCVTPVSAPHAREAGDWPGTLAEMYARWANRKGHEVELVSEQGAEPVLLVRGPNIASILCGEQGVHKLQREDTEARGHRGVRTVVQLARVDLLAVPRDGDLPFERDAVELVEATEVRARENKERAIHVVEAVEPGSGERVRVCCTDALKVALQLIAARILAQRAARPPAVDLVRVYHLARTQYVRDPRTGCRAVRPREVLDGALDPFLLAYLTQRNSGATVPTPETASVPASASDD